jgi:hypothetical protein
MLNTRTRYQRRTRDGRVLQLKREPISPEARRFVGFRARNAWVLFVNGVETETSFTLRDAVRMLREEAAR